MLDQVDQDDEKEVLKLLPKSPSKSPRKGAKRAKADDKEGKKDGGNDKDPGSYLFHAIIMPASRFQS